jgi:hypothetical protein
MSIFAPRTGTGSHSSRLMAQVLLPLLLLGSGLAHANLTDDFARANNAAIGNGWIEKYPAAFRLSGGEAVKDAVSQGYLENLVYRPANEDVLDVEASIEFRLLTGSPGYPQLLTRVQSATAPAGGQLDGYMLYVNNNTTQAIVGRQRGSAFVTALGTLDFTAALNTTNRYRLRLRTEGVSPVLVSAYVERLDGSVWTTIGQSIVSDGSASRITTAGSVGFGGYVEAAYAYDNFVRVNLGGGATNPVPAITGLAPNTAQAGENGFDLTVFGSGFTAASVVRWNGANRTTTFVSSGELTAAITPADQQSAGTYDVTVFNPAPGGGASNAAPFVVQPAVTPNPVPVAGALAPSSVTAGSAAFQLTVTGSGFASTAVIRWNGADRATTFVSPTELRTTIGSADVAAAGSADVSVFNPAPGGGLSGSLTFTINAAPPPNPAPVATALNPSSVVAGSGAFTLTVDGTGFIPASVVRIGGADRPTTYVSATRLLAAIASADVLTAGTRSITVFSPTPGGGVSGALTLTVTSPTPSNPAPVLTGLGSHTVLVGAGSTTITLTGSGFISSSQARWNGANRTTVVSSSTSANITLQAADVAAAGSGAITVVNGGPGGGTSDPLTVLVIPTGATAFFDTFKRADHAAVGNGWTEKTPAAFALANGRVQGQQTTEAYHDAIVYRPAAEDRRDLEVGLEFVRALNPYQTGIPQVHARVQRSSVTQPGTIHSYIFFIEEFQSPARAMIAVQPPLAGNDECYLRAITLPEALQAGQRYRLRLRVTGTVPVTLTGIVERFESGRWTDFASGSVNHVAGMPRDPDLNCGQPQVPDPILDGGTSGFAKWQWRTDEYDSYYWLEVLSGTPATPIITTLSPASIAAGSGATAITVTGSNFVSGSTARFNGANRTTTFVSSTQLQMALSAADLATAGSYPVTVVNPGNPPLTSNAFTLSVTSSGPPPTGFLDDFTRADSSSLGNGWIEKSPNAFSLVGGMAAKLAVGTGYRDNIAYRPASENVLDGEASVEVQFTSTNVGYAQVLTRVQTGTVASGDVLDGYILYVNNSTGQAILGRQRGSAFVVSLATVGFSETLNTSARYRMRIGAYGTTSVQVSGFVERWNGTAWVVIGSATVTDTSAQRLSTAGSAGFGGYVEAAYRYDNFRRN